MLGITFYVAGTAPQSFYTFLSILGDTIELKGWKHFAAGLDVESECLFLFHCYSDTACLSLTGDLSETFFVADNQTGTHSVYKLWHEPHEEVTVQFFKFVCFYYYHFINFNMLT